MEIKTRKIETSLEKPIKKTKLKKKGKTKEGNSKKTKLNAKELLFCYFYTQNSETFGNATRSYGEAYDYKLDTLSHEVIRDDETWDKEKGLAIPGEILEESDYQKACNVCAVEGARLLRSPKIQDKLTDLLNDLLIDRIVDRELAKVIMQDTERPAKVAAIREYNKLKQRILDKAEATLKVEAITEINYVVPAKPA